MTEGSGAGRANNSPPEVQNPRIFLILMLISNIAALFRTRRYFHSEKVKHTLFVGFCCHIITRENGKKRGYEMEKSDSL